MHNPDDSDLGKVNSFENAQPRTRWRAKAGDDKEDASWIKLPPESASRSRSLCIAGIF